MTQLSRYTLIAVLLVCSACAGKTTPSNTQTNAATSQQMAAINWDDSTMTTTMAKTTNGFLIMMR